MRSRDKTRKRILLVDDHPMMRQGLAQLIEHEADLEVCSEADSASQALNQVSARRPDLVLVDISLPDKSGLELIKDLQVFNPGLPVLVISMHDEALYAERVLRAGGRGYIMKQEGGKKLMDAIRQVLAGKIYVSERISDRILEVFSGKRGGDSGIQELTDREFEVFEMIGRGKSTREIAQHLHLSVKTVEVHRSNIKKRLKFKSGAEMVRHAIRWHESRVNAGT